MDLQLMIVWLGRAMALLDSVQESSPTLKAQYQALVDEITSGLPQKPDGTPYTIDDVRAAAEGNQELSHAIRERHSR